MRSKRSRSASRPRLVHRVGVLGEALRPSPRAGRARARSCRGAGARTRRACLPRRTATSASWSRVRARAVGVHVAGGHARHAEPLGQLGQQPVAAAVVAGEGPLQLDPQAVGPEDRAAAAAATAAASAWSPASTRARQRAVAGAAGQAHEPLGVALHVGQRHVGSRRADPGRRRPSIACAGSPALARPAPRAPCAVSSRQRLR